MNNVENFSRQCDAKLKVILPGGKEVTIGINIRPHWKEALDIIKDKNGTPCGFALPKAVAPYAIQIIPKVESEEKFAFAMDLYNKLQDAGINAIIDDREKVTMGAKIKDSKILGTPFITVIGDRQEGEIVSLEDAKTGETTSVTVEELINMLKSN